MNKNHTSAKFLTSMIQNNTGLNLMHISSNIYESMTLYVNCMDIFVAEATTTRSFFSILGWIGNGSKSISSCLKLHKGKVVSKKSTESRLLKQTDRLEII